MVFSFSPVTSHPEPSFFLPPSLPLGQFHSCHAETSLPCSSFWFTVPWILSFFLFSWFVPFLELCWSKSFTEMCVGGKCSESLLGWFFFFFCLLSHLINYSIKYWILDWNLKIWILYLSMSSLFAGDFSLFLTFKVMFIAASPFPLSCLLTGKSFQFEVQFLNKPWKPPFIISLPPFSHYKSPIKYWVFWVDLMCLAISLPFSISLSFCSPLWQTSSSIVTF